MPKTKSVMNFETSIFIRMNLQHPQHFKPFGFLCSGSFVFVYQTPLVFVKTLADIEFCFFAIVCLPETSERCIPYKVHLDNNQPQIKDKSSQRSKSICQGIITKTYNSSLRRSLGHSFRWTSKRQIGFSVEQVCRYSSSKRSYLPKRFFSSFSQYL